ncbi:MAG TPA: flagellar FlbD family protein [Actinomycetes bacterium]|nr:flagellar FlbD family protein [Actinomycetes bacterium]
MLTRLNGREFALNPDLLERAEATPDTVVTLVDGTKFVVTESVGEVIDRVRDYRASVLAQAQALELDASRGLPTVPLPTGQPGHSGHSGQPGEPDHAGGHSRVVPLHRREP